MGIPSFYKHLIQTIGGLTAKHRQSSPQVFALDLNCAIYHCARNPVLGEYTHEAKVAWENRLIQQVLGYIKDMTALVKPTEILYIAVDGVAPMAKIKQQRARRFKSSVLAAEEAKVTGKVADAERWNTNAITPGTQFMDRLGTALRGFKVAGIKVIASPADEAGEGEQKIMAWLRMQPHIRDTVVYGLDADLIVLALLEHARSGASVDLFREETEFGGGVKRDALGAEQYLYLNCGHLATALTNQFGNGKPKQEFLRDFVGIMNLMGNDFVPHGMALKINDEGIEHVLEAAKSLTEPLVSGASYNPNALATLLESLAAQEERWLLRGIRRKLDARVGGHGAKDSTAEQRALAVMNDRPVEWAAEKCMVEQRRVEGQEKPAWFFRPSWRDIYRAEALEGAVVGNVVRTYCHALSWTLRYYVGEPVDMDWYYPWHLPPLLGDIALELRKDPQILTATPTTATPLKPLEQLAMVLPVTSFDLLPHNMQDLPQRFPWAWPIAWPVFSLGRRFLWECEPRIPLIRPTQIRIMIAGDCIASGGVKK
jgi:5'-3' exonuclease